MSNSNNKDKYDNQRSIKETNYCMNNMKRVLANSNIHVANINRLLKDIKLETSADFICSNN